MACKCKDKKNKNITVLPKISISDGDWDADGRIVKTRHIEVQGDNLKDCEKSIDKYRKR